VCKKKTSISKYKILPANKFYKKHTYLYHVEILTKNCNSFLENQATRTEQRAMHWLIIIFRDTKHLLNVSGKKVLQDVFSGINM
jgi:hypothetical protein